MIMAKLQEALLAVLPHLALSSSTGPTAVYFGSGCFWERQYAYAWEVELGGSLEGNSTLFGRSMDTVTSAVGYAGSKKVGPNGRVCYHNDESQADDYDVLGHGEAVQVMLDEGKEALQFQAMLKSFFSAYTQGYRPDPFDMGGQFRSFIGIPGGINGTLYKHVVAANCALSKKNQLKLTEGKGGEDDTPFGTAWIYDSEEFPFHRGEQYHQFHSNFAPPSYGPLYLDTLWHRQIALGRINSTGCPEGQHV